MRRIWGLIVCKNCGCEIIVKMDAVYGWIHKHTEWSKCDDGDSWNKEDIKDRIAYPTPDGIAVLSSEECIGVPTAMSG